MPNSLSRIEKFQGPPEGPPPPDPVVVGLQPLEAHLEGGGLLDLDDPLEHLPRRRVSQDDDGEAPVDSGPVEIEELRVEQGVPPAEAHLASHEAIAAELPELIEDPQGRFHAQGRASTAVVTVLASQVAGLGDMPLEREHRRNEELHACLRREYGGVAPDPGKG